MIDSAPMNETRYRVICDRTNNTPATIARHELHVDLEIEPMYLGIKEIFLKECLKIAREITIEKQSKLPDHLFDFGEK